MQKELQTNGTTASLPVTVVVELYEDVPLHAKCGLQRLGPSMQSPSGFAGSLKNPGRQQGGFGRLGEKAISSANTVDGPHPS